MAVQYKRTGPQGKRKIKFGYFLLIVVSIALLLLLGFVCVQRQNIKAIYGAVSSSTDEIKQQQEKNEQKTRDILDSLTDADIKELTEDMRIKLKNGEITEQQAMDAILGTDASALPNKDDSNKNEISENNSNIPGNGDSNNDSSVGRKEKIIAEIYLLRATYLNKIDGLISSGKATISSIPKEEFTLSKKMSVLNTYKSRGSALEAECDSQMEALLNELDSELKNLGESTAVISEIRNAYNEQKHLKKEEILSTYYSR